MLDRSDIDRNGSLLLRQNWLPPEPAIDLYVRFEERHGSTHSLLACYAAFAYILSPELINLIRINFLDHESIHWIAEADFLLSPMCRPIGNNLYQVDPGAREVLLQDFMERVPNPWREFHRLADFLLAYVASRPWANSPPELPRVYQWIAWSFRNPSYLVDDMSRQLRQQVEASDGASVGLRAQQLHIGLIFEMQRLPIEYGLPESQYRELKDTAYVLAHYWYQSGHDVQPDIELATRQQPNQLLDSVLKGMRNITGETLEITPKPTSLETPADKGSGSRGQRRDFFRHVPLPPSYIIRPELLAALKTAILDESRPIAVSSSVKLASKLNVLHGAGGFGKTVAVRAICEDPEVQAAFPDGILWASLGQEPDLTRCLRGWASCLDVAGIYDSQTIEELRHAINLALSQRVCLLIADDVWQPEHVRVLDVGGPRCKLVITTRNAALTEDMGAVVFTVPLMSVAEAVMLLEEGAQGALASVAQVEKVRIVQRLGRLPLAIRLAGAQLRDGNVAEWLAAFDILEHGVQGHKIANVQDTLMLTLTLSLNLLQPLVRPLYAALAIFGEDEAIPELVINKLWLGLGKFDSKATDEVLRDLAERALLQRVREGTVEVVYIHSLMRTFIATDLGDVGTQNAHKVLLESYATMCPVSANGHRRWYMLPNDGYMPGHLVWHMVRASNVNAVLSELRAAVVDYQDEGDQFATSETLRLIAEVQLSRGDYVAASDAFDGAIEAAIKVGSSFDRTRTLVALLPFLVEPKLSHTVQRAAESALAIVDSRERAKALDLLLPYLPVEAAKSPGNLDPRLDDQDLSANTIGEPLASNTDNQAGEGSERETLSNKGRPLHLFATTSATRIAVSHSELVERCLSGDAGAWEQLVDRYSRLVASVPARYGLRTTEIEDITQEVFLALAQNLQTIEDPDHLPAWLVMTARRLCLKLAQRNRREQSLDEDPMSAEEWALQTELANRPEDLVVLSERSDILRAAMAKLPTRCRKLLELIYLDSSEPSLDEISALLDIPRGSIAPIRRRCLNQLRLLMSEVDLPDEVDLSSDGDKE